MATAIKRTPKKLFILIFLSPYLHPEWTLRVSIIRSKNQRIVVEKRFQQRDLIRIA
jgi:hypothetical protein